MKTAYGFITREIRRMTGLSQELFGFEIGKTQDFVSDIETCKTKRKLQKDDCIRIREVFGGKRLIRELAEMLSNDMQWEELMEYERRLIHEDNRYRQKN